MSILVVGMSHRCAPVRLLEQVSMDDTTRIRATQELVACSSIEEAMILSTCNRVEIYAVTTGFHTGVNEIIDVLEKITAVPQKELRTYLYVRYADAAAEHLLYVTAGLDSMVVGEQQIIGQVRTAYQLAQEAGTVGYNLHSVVQSALHAGKRVHTETEIDDTGASMVSFALNEAFKEQGWEDMKGKTALVMGAGVMASMAATYLGKKGVDKLYLANRTLTRAQTLAEHSIQAGVPAQAIPFEERTTLYSSVDMIVSATGADNFIIKAQDMPMRCPSGAASLVLVDLSLPRDIEDSCTDIPGISLINIEKLHEVSHNIAAGPTAHAKAIVAEELESYSSAERIRDIAPSVAALRKHARELINNELQRLASRTPLMAEEDRVEVEKSIRRVVDKLLHEPTVKVKELAAHSGTVSYESALQELFGLPESVLPENSPVAVQVKEIPVEVR